MAEGEKGCGGPQMAGQRWGERPGTKPGEQAARGTKWKGKALRGEVPRVEGMGKSKGEGDSGTVWCRQQWGKWRGGKV